MFRKGFVKESMVVICLLVLGGFFLFSNPGKEVPSAGLISEVNDDPVVSPKSLVTPKGKIGDIKQSPGLSPSLSPKPAMSPLLSPSNTPVTNDTHANVTTSPTPSQSAVPSISVVPSHAPSPFPSATLSPTPNQTQQVVPARVVINEIAWAGSQIPNAGSADEWIELYNFGGMVDLSGWALYEGDTKIVLLSGPIPSNGYFLIERVDDTTVADVTAHVYGSFGGSGLNNKGEHLQLRDQSGQVIDAVDCSAGWFAGANETKATMERIDPMQSGNEPENWKSNDGITRNGIDAAGNPINGTPRAKNSVQ